MLLIKVTAKTNLGWGYAAKGLVFTTNNRESPQPPSAPRVSPSQVQSREITFSWNPGSDGYAPLRYKIIARSWNYFIFRSLAPTPKNDLFFKKISIGLSKLCHGIGVFWVLGSFLCS